VGLLKSQMDQLLGAGQPGRLVHLEERVEGHERSMQRMKGFIGAAGIVVSVLHLVIDYLCR
jgi:hypothetical protein